MHNLLNSLVFFKRMVMECGLISIFIYYTLQIFYIIQVLPA
jgi:hypothetical protein